MIRVSAHNPTPKETVDHYAKIAVSRGYWEALRQFEVDILKATKDESITVQASKLKLLRTCLSNKLRKLGLTNNPAPKKLNPDLVREGQTVSNR